MRCRRCGRPLTALPLGAWCSMGLGDRQGSSRLNCRNVIVRLRLQWGQQVGS